MSFGIVLIFFRFALFGAPGEVLVCLRDAQYDQLGFGIGRLMGSLARIGRKPTPASNRIKIIPKWRNIAQFTVPEPRLKERVALQAVPCLVGHQRLCLKCAL